MVTLICGVIQLCSKENLTKKATPRNSANPPSQAKSLTPRKLSQLIVAGAGRTGDRFGNGGCTGSEMTGRVILGSNMGGIGGGIAVTGSGAGEAAACGGMCSMTSVGSGGGCSALAAAGDFLSDFSRSNSYCN